VAHLFGKLCTTFHQNRSSFVEDSTKTFWSLFSGTQCSSASIMDDRSCYLYMPLALLHNRKYTSRPLLSSDLSSVITNDQGIVCSLSPRNCSCPDCPVHRTAVFLYLLLLPPEKLRGIIVSVVYVCLMYVCNTVTFKSLDVESIFLVIRYSLRDYG